MLPTVRTVCVVAISLLFLLQWKVILRESGIQKPKVMATLDILQFSLLVAVGWMTMGLGSVGTQTSDKEAELCLSDLFFFVLSCLLVSSITFTSLIFQFDPSHILVF